jgi:hypothetical protein
VGIKDQISSSSLPPIVLQTLRENTLKYFYGSNVNRDQAILQKSRYDIAMMMMKMEQIHWWMMHI